MKAGAKLNFGKAEVFWPQDDSASDNYQTLLGLKSNPSAQSQDLVAPTFDAKVKVDAQIDVKVTPEASPTFLFTVPEDAIWAWSFLALGFNSVVGGGDKPTADMFITGKHGSQGWRKNQRRLSAC